MTDDEVAAARAYRDRLREITDHLACQLRGWVTGEVEAKRVASLTRELFGLLLGTDELTLRLGDYDYEQARKREAGDAA